MNRIARPLLFAVALLLAFASSGFAYVFIGYHWPDGTQIMMHLQLTRASGSLQDGSPSWDASAADALATWNQYISKVKFVQAPESSTGQGDGQNSVFFSNYVYGQSFGANVLAITLSHSYAGVVDETDVIFNNARSWNSYRGPQQGYGASATYDLHRVALHEFGHVLGLDHPDEHGQPDIEAIMNSIISNLDHLADDDIAGALSLYSQSITSSQTTQVITSGDLFSYQITSNNNPASYSVTGLPAGLQVNSATGLISGRCTTSGTFTIKIVVQGSTEPATGTFTLVVQPINLTSSAYPPFVYIGSGFSYQITAGNSPTSFSATGLPAGLTLDPATGIISGVATVTGNFTVFVIARSVTSEASGTVEIDISAPRITNTDNFVQLQLGDSFSLQITVSHPVTSFSATGLPPGFQFDSASGVLTGTATSPGYFYVSIIANTSYGQASGLIRLVILAPQITSATELSAQLGQDFSYQITASNHPTSFSVASLPAGLALDPASGVISGVPSLSGYYRVSLTAHGSVGDAEGFLSLYVQPATTYNPPDNQISLVNINSVVSDPSRPYLYVGTQQGLYILSPDSFTPIATFPNDHGARGLGLSADGKRLFWGVTDQAVIKSLDLDTLQLLPDISNGGHVADTIRQASDGVLYFTDPTQHGSFFAVNPGNALVTQIDPQPNTYQQLTIQLVPDRSTLFVATISPGTWTMEKYGVGSGPQPTLLQKIQGPGSSRELAISPDGQFLALTTAAFDGSPNTVSLRSTNDLNVVVGSLPSQQSANNIAFTSNGLAVQTYANVSRIDIFDLTTRTLIQTIVPPDQAIPETFVESNLTADSSGSHLYFTGATDYSHSTLYSYPLARPIPQPPHSLLNVATRLRAQTGDNVLIGGFIVTGTEPKKVLLRATGPSLPVSDSLQDPILELHGPDGSLLSQNDNWNTNRTEILRSGLPPADEHESAIVATLAPGAYTAIIRGLGDASGVALVELYDLSPESLSRIGNISTRGRVETGDNVMIGGFIIGGDQPTKVIVRAIGPSLANRGVAGALADTTLELHDGNGNLFASNDDWQSDQAQEIVDSTVPPDDPRESAIVRTLTPGNYTAIVRGKNETTGVALVEVYNLEAP